MPTLAPGVPSDGDSDGCGQVVDSESPLCFFFYITSKSPTSETSTATGEAYHKNNAVIWNKSSRPFSGPHLDNWNDSDNARILLASTWIKTPLNDRRLAFTDAGRQCVVPTNTRPGYLCAHLSPLLGPIILRPTAPVQDQGSVNQLVLNKVRGIDVDMHCANPQPTFRPSTPISAPLVPLSPVSCQHCRSKLVRTIARTALLRGSAASSTTSHD